jgi:tight adherence protein B
MTLFIMALAAMAAWMWLKPSVLGARLEPVKHLHERRHRLITFMLAGLAAVGLIIVAVAWSPGAIGVSLAMVAGTISWVVWRKRCEKQAMRTMNEVARACRVMESLLRLGNIPNRAVVMAAEQCPVLADAAATSRMGGDVADVLENLGHRPGATGLIDVSRAWRVTQRTGAPLKEALAKVSRNLIADAELSVTVNAELASTRATSQLLAILPVFGLGLAHLMGTDIAHFFTGTLPGRLCLLIGVALACVGVVWSDVLASRAALHHRTTRKNRPILRKPAPKLTAARTAAAQPVQHFQPVPDQTMVVSR